MNPTLRAVIDRHGLAARKSLGQHFLLDENLLARIVRCAGPLAGRHVVEIGPGPGGLTRALLATDAASVTAIEIDPRAAAAIRELADPRLTLIEADARTLDAAALAPPPRQIIANLPYNVGSALLVRWLHQAAAWEHMTLMFQQEVAERLAAAPNTPAYGRLSVLTQATCTAAIALRIPAAAFWPPPKITSAVVTLTPHPQQPPPALLAALERVTAAAFGQRRKMLRTALKPLGGEALLARAGIAPTRRAETLTVAEFLTLAAMTSESAAMPPPGLVIHDFTDALAADFASINAEWIGAMFTLEATDREVLENPRTRIIEPGGAILFVEAPGLGIVGACALQRTGGSAIELTKMGVRAAARGRKAGEFLLAAALDRARAMGADPLYLLTNARCEAAIHLYEKRGFRHDPEIMRQYGARYCRCDVAMRWHDPMS